MIRSIFIVLITVAFAAFGAYACSDDSSGASDADTDTDSDSDSDSDMDTDTDTDADSDTDTDADSDTDTDADSDTDTDADSDTDTDSVPTTDGCDDNDGDGWCIPFDCDDTNDAIYPGAPETILNDIDEDCDGADDTVAPDTETDTSSDDVCQESDFVITPVPVTLMILEDMSRSMDPGYVSSDHPGNWSIVRPAIVNLLNTFADQIEFGLDMFPEEESCNIRSEPLTDCTPNNADAIIAMLPGDDAPNGSTPLLLAMNNYNSDTYAPQCQDIEKQSYLLVISDGEDRCGGGESGEGRATANDLKLKTEELLARNIKTFVIGFGDGVDADQLNAIAAAGGTEFTEFLLADNQIQLETAFNQIASSIVNCNYDVPPAEEGVDQDDVNFYFDGTVVPFNDGCASADTDTPAVGWSWTDDTMSEVEFCEAACEQLQDGNVAISATWGCPTVIVEIQ